MLSGLRGRGGAGFSCGLKWSFVDRKSGKPIYLICNADESEPGTFKDRQIIYKDPHQLIEGMIICLLRQRRAPGLHLHPRRVRRGRAHPEPRAGRSPAGRISWARTSWAAGYDLEIHVHRGAGAYICGEETGLIESLEGKRAYPRIKPPYFPAVLGLYLCPTIVNNVETLCAVKHIVAMGGAEYAKLGTPNNTGTRIVSLSGHVKRPGYYEIEVGKVTLGELIFDPDFGGGLRDGRQLKAVIPGGSSAKVLQGRRAVQTQETGPRWHGRPSRSWTCWICPMTSTRWSPPAACRGSGAIIVMDDSADMVEALANICPSSTPTKAAASARPAAKARSGWPRPCNA